MRILSTMLIGAACVFTLTGCPVESNLPQTSDISTDQDTDAEEKEEGVDCPSIWEPVCADGITYDNECLADNAGVTDFSEGECD